MDCMLDKYLVVESESLINALKIIYKNKKGFVVVVDEEFKLKGTLSDGDVRRALISGHGLKETIKSIIHGTCKKIDVSDGISEAIDIFKDEQIKFLPIVDEYNRVVNVLSKY